MGHHGALSRKYRMIKISYRLVYKASKLQKVTQMFSSPEPTKSNNVFCPYAPKRLLKNKKDKGADEEKENPTKRKIRF